MQGVKSCMKKAEAGMKGRRILLIDVSSLPSERIIIEDVGQLLEQSRKLQSSNSSSSKMEMEKRNNKNMTPSFIFTACILSLLLLFNPRKFKS